MSFDNLPVRFSPSEDGTLSLAFVGSWQISGSYGVGARVREELNKFKNIKRMRCDFKELDRWDTSLVAFLYSLFRMCKEKQIEFIRVNTPQGMDRLLSLATSNPTREDAARGAEDLPFIERAGQWGIEQIVDFANVLAFIGGLSTAFGKLFTGRAKFRIRDLVEAIEDVGPGALPIVTLISLLVGLILAFIGSIQLQKFGAQIYIANLVGIAMLREMGAIMAGVIMAGRTGAAFAAQLGTMQSNEEVDALRTLGFNPMEFLVLPRVIALVLMMPLLCIYADLVGVLGGAIIGISIFDISLLQYLKQTELSVTLTHLWIGVGKSVIFGYLVAVCGCIQGFYSGRSAAAVGNATTSAVVTGIVCIVVADAFFAVACNVLGI